MSTAEGREAERLAARYLQARGMTLVTRNWRGGGGELDLVLMDGEVLVVAEVKLRPDELDAVNAVGPEKARRLAGAAAAFLRAAGLSPEIVRFDIVTVRGRSEISHHPDAFRP